MTSLRRRRRPPEAAPARSSQGRNRGIHRTSAFPLWPARVAPLLWATKEASADAGGLRVLCHGLSGFAATGGRLLQPGDAEAEPLEAGGIHRAFAFSAASAPDLRAGAIVSP